MRHASLKLFLLCLSCFFYGCSSHSQTPGSLTKAKIITHYNVLIVPDLSNRLKRSAGLPDVGILRSVMQHIYPKIATFKRSMNQKDRFSMVLSSKNIGTLYNADFSKMSIDLGAFRSQRERIDYLMNRTPGHTLTSDTGSFISEFLRIETAAKQKHDGADIWSFFNSGLDRNLVAFPEKPFDNQRFQNSFRNILVLLTDGYIEAGISGAAGCEGYQCRYLRGQLIGKFRQAYLKRKDKKESLQSFFQRNGYGITAVSNPNLKYFGVLVLEIDDRSLTATGNATVEPSDYEIIKLFWEDWLKRSGVQHFEMHPLARNAGDAERNILSFLGIP